MCSYFFDVQESTQARREVGSSPGCHLSQQVFVVQEITLLENSQSQRPVLSRSNSAADQMFDVGQGDVLKFENIAKVTAYFLNVFLVHKHVQEIIMVSKSKLFN